ncbi:MAG: MAPEG family protein [Bradymonadia bacterium]
MSDLMWNHTSSTLAIYGFCIIHLCLVLAIVSQRTVLTLIGQRKANQFAPTGDDASPFMRRLIRAHANMTESFPLWGILLVALATDQTSITDGLAVYCLGARLGQVITHLFSTSERAVKIRFALFIVQLGIFIRWLFGFSTVWLTCQT